MDKLSYGIHGIFMPHGRSAEGSITGSSLASTLCVHYETIEIKSEDNHLNTHPYLETCTCNVGEMLFCEIIESMHNINAYFSVISVEIIASYIPRISGLNESVKESYSARRLGLFASSNLFLGDNYEN